MNRSHQNTDSLQSLELALDYLSPILNFVYCFTGFIGRGRADFTCILSLFFVIFMLVRWCYCSSKFSFVGTLAYCATSVYIIQLGVQAWTPAKKFRKGMGAIPKKVPYKNKKGPSHREKDPS